MTTHRRMTLGLPLVALSALAAAESEGKRCLATCSAEIASCQVTCAVGGRRSRRRCRNACQRSVIASCRAYDGPECVDPTTSAATPDATTTTSTTDPGSPTTTSTTLPATGDRPTTGFFPNVHVTSSQVDRTYSLFVPSSYVHGRSYPVGFAFYGAR